MVRLAAWFIVRLLFIGYRPLAHITKAVNLLQNFGLARAMSNSLEHCRAQEIYTKVNQPLDALKDVTDKLEFVIRSRFARNLTNLSKSNKFLLQQLHFVNDTCLGVAVIPF